MIIYALILIKLYFYIKFMIEKEVEGNEGH